MLHPHTELGAVSPEIGVGVFARAPIPKGTVVYIKDPLEICIPSDDTRLLQEGVRSIIDRYSYTEANGNRILSWDLAKYVNHSCDPNTISTGYGFEIAIRDIAPGDEITDDYGLLNIEQVMACNCGSSRCRKRIRPDDLQRHYPRWDRTVREALLNYREVEQPLEHLLDDLTRYQLKRYLDGGKDYLSVIKLHYRHLQAPPSPGLAASKPA